MGVRDSGAQRRAVTGEGIARSLVQFSWGVWGLVLRAWGGVSGQGSKVGVHVSVCMEAGRGVRSQDCPMAY